MHIWIVSTNDINEAEANRLEKFLSYEELSRAKNFFKNQDRINYIVAHSLKRKMLSVYLGNIDPKKIKFLKDKNGKPILSEYKLDFNLSHSHSVVACAVNEYSECGLDIENYRRIKNLTLLSKKVLTQKEQQTQSKSIDANNDFLDRWVVKEAVLKKSGVGLAGDMNGICTVSNYEKIDGNRSLMSDHHIYQYKSSDYTLAACTQSADDTNLRKLKAVML